MLIHKLALELKMDMERKKELEKKRAMLLVRISNGKDFFEKEQKSPTHLLNGAAQTEWLSKQVKVLTGYLETLIEIETEITEIDTILTIKAEVLFTDSLVKFELPVRLDESGDQGKKEPAIFVPVATGNTDFVEITPEDLKFVLLLRDKFHVRNLHMLETIPKSQYTGG